MSFNFQWVVIDARSQNVFTVVNNQLVRWLAKNTNFEDKRFTAQYKLRAYSDVSFVYNRAGELFVQGQGGDAWLSGIQSLWSEPQQDTVILKFRYLL
ncbi:hypothetical protein NI389_12235 [Pseudoalteromonas xiamenensis]|uniref:hypothetical protein n=1 Tax=Pseudoalteromonas xiamenensis TaxID=882626 RepID=UPI0027E4F488|nr:hypothetical protein [Pseudoalteromonas xiamenensis]WMN58983.1 hypothetical protein NI389_12235 [Pseudoalteromonas xiamenensis]